MTEPLTVAGTTWLKELALVPTVKESMNSTYAVNLLTFFKVIFKNLLLKKTTFYGNFLKSGLSCHA